MNNTEFQELLTVKEFAELVGIKHQAVYQSKTLQPYIVQSNGKKMVKREALSLYEKKEDDKKETAVLQAEIESLKAIVQSLTATITQDETKLTVANQKIDELTNRCADKEKQCADQNAQLLKLIDANAMLTQSVDKLTENLTAAQALHAGTMQELKLLKAASAENNSPITDIAPEDLNETESDDNIEPQESTVEAAPAVEPAPQEPKKGFFARLFGL